MKFVTKDGIKLDYSDQGQGQAVILIAGFGGYQEIWQSQVSYLLGMHCRVITYDHRNHGRSQRTQKGLTIEQLTNDLSELIAYLKLEKPILIGHSMGASICYAYLHHYQNIKAVLAIDQSPKMLNDDEWQYGFESITIDNFIKEISQPNNVHETLRGLDRVTEIALEKVRNQYPFERSQNLPLLIDHVQKDWRQTLYDSDIPVTLVVARQSPYFDYHFANLFSEHNQKITKVILDNCGHDIMAEIPNEFNQILRHFIFRSLRKS